MDLKLRPKEECKFDEISLGEIMLRLDPGEGRIKTSRTFRAWEGGGEYNVARGLRRCFGMRTGVVTAFAENEVGYLLEDLILQGGVDTSLIRWVPFDGIGRSVRNGLNFVERGYGIRGAVSTSDRGNTAISQLKPGDVDWDYIFGTLGVRWLHTRRDLRRFVGEFRCRGAGGSKGCQKVRHRGILRLELPCLSVEGHRRPGKGPGSEQGDRQVY